MQQTRQKPKGDRSSSNGQYRTASRTRKNHASRKNYASHASVSHRTHTLGTARFVGATESPDRGQGYHHSFVVIAPSPHMTGKLVISGAPWSSRHPKTQNYLQRASTAQTVPHAMIDVRPVSLDAYEAQHTSLSSSRPPHTLWQSNGSSRNK
jgi:hypothetical protein